MAQEIARVNAGGSTRYECVTTVSAPHNIASIVWTGPTVMGSGVRVTQESFGHIVMSSLEIETVSAKDAGLYMCFYETNFLKSFQLTVIGEL